MEHDQEMFGRARGCVGQERAREQAVNLAIGCPWDSHSSAWEWPWSHSSASSHGQDMCTHTHWLCRLPAFQQGSGKISKSQMDGMEANTIFMYVSFSITKQMRNVLQALFVWMKMKPVLNQFFIWANSIHLSPLFTLPILNLALKINF